MESQPEDGIAVAPYDGIVRHNINSIPTELAPVIPLVHWIFERWGKKASDGHSADASGILPWT